MRTQVCTSSMKSRLEDTAAEWHRVLRGAANRRAVTLDEPALLIVVAATDARGKRSLKAYVKSAARGPIASIVGAHAACDVPGVFGACLRHVAVWTDASVRPGWVHALDLHTPDGLLVDGEAGIRRVDARCSVRIGAGSADLLAMALLPGENVDVDMLPAFAAPFIPRSRAPARAPSAVREAPLWTTREAVTLVRLGHEREDVPGAALVLRPTREELQRGFLLGRYDRCAGQLDDARVSRVHAVLVEHGDGVLVIDTASTNGTDVFKDVCIAADQEGAVRQEPSFALGIVNRTVPLPRGFALDLGGSVVVVR